jgi:hypothetical protein
LQAATRTVLRLSAAANLIVCLGFLALAAPSYRQQYRILATWPAVEATVVRSRVLALPTDSSQTLYDAEYTFAFWLRDGMHQASLGSNHLSSNRERKEKQVARFPEGTRHSILYNPADPTDIRMQPGYNVHFFAVPVFISGVGLIFGVIALLLWWSAWPRAKTLAKSPS